MADKLKVYPEIKKNEYKKAWIDGAKAVRDKINSMYEQK